MQSQKVLLLTKRKISPGDSQTLYRYNSITMQPLDWNGNMALVYQLGEAIREHEPASASLTSNGRLIEKVEEIGEQSCRLLLGDEMTAALDPERP